MQRPRWIARVRSAEGDRTSAHRDKVAVSKRPRILSAARAVNTALRNGLGAASRRKSAASALGREAAAKDRQMRSLRRRIATALKPDSRSAPMLDAQTRSRSLRRPHSEEPRESKASSKAMLHLRAPFALAGASFETLSPKAPLLRTRLSRHAPPSKSPPLRPHYAAASPSMSSSAIPMSFILR